MKTIVSSFFCGLVLCSTCMASQIEDEAVNSLATAQDFIKKGNYTKATDEINYALAKLNELTAEGLLKYIPDAPDGFSLVDKQSQGGAGMAAIAGSAGANAQYSGSDGSTVNLSIVIGGMTGKMAGLAAFGSMFAGIAQDSGAGQTKQIRVNGYTGTQIYNANEKSGTLTFQVGGKTSVILEGQELASPDSLMAIAAKIDFAGLEKNF